MAEVARVMHAGRALSQELAAAAADHNLHIGEADVLFTLYRAGVPHRLTPTELAELTLVTSGTMTNRVDKLEERGLVRRVPSPDDRRSLAVELTRKGMGLTDRLVTDHVDNEEALLAGLSANERRELARILRKLLEHLGR